MGSIQLSAGATAILVGSYIVMMLVMVILITAIAFVLFKLNATLVEYQAKLEPILDQIQSVLSLANSKLNSIGDKTEAILTQGEVTAETVHEKVEKTATIVQRTVNAPFIGLNALSAGLSSAVRTFGTLQREPAVAVEAETVEADLIVETLVVSNVSIGEFSTAHNAAGVTSNV